MADEDQLEVAERIGVGMLIVDARGQIRSANHAAHALLGRRDGSLKGRTPMEAFVDHRVDGLIRGARADEDVQMELTTASEPARTIVVRARRTRDSISVLLEDASELRRLRRIRTEFIDNLAHELRTPLTTMRLLAESMSLELERSDGVPQRIRDYATKIDDETEHLAQMVTELLDLAQIEQGEAPLRATRLDPAAVVDATLERLRPFASRRSVTLQSQIEGNAESRRVSGDEERLGQVVMNLLHNAIKYSDDGGEVIVGVVPTETEVVISVKDDGPGIPRHDLERIFERFYKVDRARTDRTGGTGLGLSIARHVVERHGGRIWAESQVGHGSTFRIALPKSV